MVERTITEKMLQKLSKLSEELGENISLSLDNESNLKKISKVLDKLESTTDFDEYLQPKIIKKMRKSISNIEKEIKDLEKASSVFYKEMVEPLIDVTDDDFSKIYKESSFYKNMR